MPRGDDNPKCNLCGTSPTSGAEEPHIRPQDVTLDPHRGVSDSPKDGIPAQPVTRTLRNAHTFTHQPFFMCICIWCFLNLSRRSITASCCLYRIVVYGIVVMFISKKKKCSVNVFCDTLGSFSCNVNPRNLSKVVVCI